MIEAKLSAIESVLQRGKMSRFFFNPIGYVGMIVSKYLLSGFFPNGIKWRVKTIFDFDYHIILPSNSDFLIFGCKSNISDLRLINYFLHHLNTNDTLLDVGANFGFYSLLASQEIGHTGKIIAVEPNVQAFNILKRNFEGDNRFVALNILASNTRKSFTMNEFPVEYAEFNTVMPDKFISGSKWFKKYSTRQRTLQSDLLDDILTKNEWCPDIIKVDTENSDLMVVEGLANTISKTHPDFILRFWPSHRDNKIQIATIDLLLYAGYKIYGINNDGSLYLIDDKGKLENYLLEYLLMQYPKRLTEIRG